MHKNRISRACHTCGGEGDVLVEKPEEKGNLESLSIDGSRSMWKWIIKAKEKGTGSICLWLGKEVESFHKMRWISWLSDASLTSQWRLCLLQLLSWLHWELLVKERMWHKRATKQRKQVIRKSTQNTIYRKHIWWSASSAVSGQILLLTTTLVSRA